VVVEDKKGLGPGLTFLVKAWFGQTGLRSALVAGKGGNLLKPELFAKTKARRR
jgi:hypothetical protein